MVSLKLALSGMQSLSTVSFFIYHYLSLPYIHNDSVCHYATRSQ